MAGEPVNAAAYRCTIHGMATVLMPRRVVEVGVYAGDLSKMLAGLPSVEELILVDPWTAPYGRFNQAHMDAVAKRVEIWASAESKVRVIRAPSDKAASSIENESVDFWHTDGDHAYEMVRRDIKSWLPKIRPGGFLTGDNYEASSVARAVDELLPDRQLAAKGRVWWKRK